MHAGKILSRKVTNQKLATSNLNFRAPKFGQKGELSTEIMVTTEMTDATDVPSATSVVSENLKSAVFRPLWPVQRSWDQQKEKDRFSDNRSVL